jgi:plasmid stabilization system protein ParE
MAKLIWSQKSAEDLELIHDYIAILKDEMLSE